MSIKGKPLVLFFKLRLDFKQFHQKEKVKVVKQPNSKSITVLKRRYIQYDKKIGVACSSGFVICDPPTIHHALLNCKLSCAVKFKSLILKIWF